MAYDPTDQDSNQQNETAQAQQPQAPATTSGAPGAGPASAAPGKGTAPQATPAQPFQNLQAYLSANAPQVTAQANKIAGDLNNQYGQVTSAIDQGQTNFNNQVNAGYTQNNPNVVNQAAANPTEFANDPNNVKAFQSLYNDTYTGPANYESTGSYGDMSANINKAMSDAALLGSNGGIQTYFQGKNPNATKGGSVLDSVLLQGTPDAYSSIKNAAKPFANLNDYLNNATTIADQNATNASSEANRISSETQGRFGGQGGIIPQFQKDINDRVTQAQNDATARAKSVTDSLKGGDFSKLSDADLASLGLTRQQADEFSLQERLLNTPANLKKIYDANPRSGNQKGVQDAFMQQILDQFGGVNFDQSRYITPTSSDVGINPANFATPQEYEEAAALSKLTGQDLSGFLNPANISKAGTAPKELVNYDYPGALKESQNLYQQILKGFGGDPNGWDQIFRSYLTNPAVTG